MEQNKNDKSAINQKANIEDDSRFGYKGEAEKQHSVSGIADDYYKEDNKKLTREETLKKEEIEKPVEGIVENINAESKNFVAAEESVGKKYFSNIKNIGEKDRILKLAAAAVGIVSVIAVGYAVFNFFQEREAKKEETPQQIIKSSMEAMKSLKTYASHGNVSLNLNMQDTEKKMNVEYKFNIGLSDKADVSDVNNPKGQYVANVKADMKGEGGNEDYSANFEGITFGQKEMYFKLNDYDLGTFGILMGPQISTYKGKWYFLDIEELKKMPGYNQENDFNVESYDMNKIMEIVNKYEILKFKKDLGDSKLGDVDVYHYQVGVDGLAAVYMYLDILKETVASSYKDNGFKKEAFEKGIAQMRKDAEENYRDLINEGFGNVEVELWIGKNDRYARRMIISGSLGEKYINKFLNSAMGSARAKAMDAKIKSGVSGARPSLEKYYDENNGSYENFKPSEYSDLKPENIKTNKNAYVIWSELSSTTDKFCVDSTGKSGYVLEEISGFGCPDSLSDALKGEKKEYVMSEEEKNNQNVKVNLNFSADISYSDFNKPVEINKPEGAINFIQEMNSSLGSIFSIPSVDVVGNPNSADPDNDGLTDEMEIFFGTDASNPDTDGDGFKDGDEVNRGYDPLLPGSAKLDYDKLFNIKR